MALMDWIWSSKYS